MLTTFFCTIVSFHQISSLKIFSSSIYNHVFLLWYFPMSCGFSNLIGYYCRTPVTIHNIDGCEGESFWGTQGGICGIFFSLRRGNLSLSNKREFTRTNLTHNLTWTQSLKNKDHKRFLLHLQWKRYKMYKNVIYSLFFFFYLSGSSWLCVWGVFVCP